MAIARTEIDGRERHLPICLGLSGASTTKMLDALDETAAWPIDFYLIASPYYTRPSQRGLLQHFTALADHAAWPLLIYNIPYRTAVDIDQRHAASARRASKHRRHEGLLRRPRAVDRFPCETALRLSRVDRRGRAILMTRSTMAPTARSCCRHISKPARSPRWGDCCAKATAMPRLPRGRASPN